MSTTETISFAVELAGPDGPNQAEVAAAAFFARYSGRTLEAYRYDLRSFFQWAADVGLEVLFATRPHIELFRSALEARDWPQRRSTGGSPRSAASIASPTSTGGSPPTPPSTCAARPSTAPKGGASIAPSSGASSSPPSTSTTPTGRSPSCSA